MRNEVYYHQGEEIGFQPSPQDAGFWLRRHRDGSYLSLKKAVITILKKFDSSLLYDIFHKDKLKKPYYGDNIQRTQDDTLIMSFIDLDLYLTGLVNTCDYESTPPPGDTIELSHGYLNCVNGEISAFAVRKQEEISDVEMTIYGTKKLFLQIEEEKGGVASDGSISPIYSEKIILKPVYNVSYPFPDIFKDKKIQWNKFKKDELERMEAMSGNSSRWTNVEPAELIMELKWKVNRTGHHKHKMIKIQYSYGD